MGKTIAPSASGAVAPKQRPCKEYVDNESVAGSAPSLYEIIYVGGGRRHSTVHTVTRGTSSQNRSPRKAGKVGKALGCKASDCFNSLCRWLVDHRREHRLKFNLNAQLASSSTRRCLSARSATRMGAVLRIWFAFVPNRVRRSVDTWQDINPEPIPALGYFCQESGGSCCLAPDTDQLQTMSSTRRPQPQARSKRLRAGPRGRRSARFPPGAPRCG